LIYPPELEVKETNILDIFLDFFIFIHFHYVKMHRL
jgi:hypothetical protein